jgi:CIC family chloride channel protein
MRSPLTGMIFTWELTHDFNALPVLLVGCVTALAVTVLVLRRSILTEKLARRGRHIAREYSVDIFELMRAGEVMDRKVPTIPANWTVLTFSERMTKGDLNGARHAAFIVDAQEKLAGIITRSDALRTLRLDPTGTITVLAAGQTHLVVTFPDEPLCDAIAKMLKHNLGRLPVVEREDHRQLLGYLGRADILAARLRQHEEEESRNRGPLWAGSGFKGSGFKYSEQL